MREFQYYLTRVKNFLGYKTHDEQLFESSQNKLIIIKVISTIKKLIICSSIMFMLYLYNIKTKQDLAVARMEEWRPEELAHRFPLRDLNDLLSYSKKCEPISSYTILDNQDLITVRSNPLKWTVMNTTLLFMFMEDRVKNHSTQGMYTYCSTMFGFEGMPCACASRMKDGSMHWIADIVNTDSFDDLRGRELSLVKEANFIFSELDGIIIHKYVPKSAAIEYVRCSPNTNNGLSCKNIRETFYGTDVFIFSRTSYLLHLDPQKYTNVHPDFGSFNIVSKDPIVKNI